MDKFYLDLINKIGIPTDTDFFEDYSLGIVTGCVDYKDIKEFIIRNIKTDNIMLDLISKVPKINIPHRMRNKIHKHLIDKIATVLMLCKISKLDELAYSPEEDCINAFEIFSLLPESKLDIELIYTSLKYLRNTKTKWKPQDQKKILKIQSLEKEYEKYLKEFIPAEAFLKQTRY